MIVRLSAIRMVLLCVFAVVFQPAGGLAKGMSEKVQPFERRLDAHVVFNKDGLRTLTYRIETKINAASAVQGLGQHRVRTNSFFNAFEILEAATLKADGRRIDVARDKILKLSGSARHSALFNADSVTYVVPFPDLAAGDRTLLVFRRKQKRLQIPGFVSMRWLFDTRRGITSTNLKIDVPDNIRMRFAEYGVVRSEESIDGGRRYRWVVAGGRDAQRERLSVSRYDHGPRIFMSNLDSWDAFAKRYYPMIARFAEPDEMVRKKADEITRGLEGEEAIARALFTWTQRNIRYFRVFLGNGGLVPHQCRSILKAGYGDCKDHATILKAFLAAKNINSEFVLINQRRVYGEFPLPMAAYDHMILYVPSLKRYLDPTASLSSFDHLPLSLQGKPALRVNANGGVVERTPVRSPAANRIELRVKVRFDDDGLARGTASFHGAGPLAQLLRSRARRIETSGADSYATRIMKSQNLRGTAEISAPPPFALVEPFAIKVDFRIETGAETPGRAIAIPVGPRLYAPPLKTFSRGIKEQWSRPFVCTPLTYVETLEVEWPKKMRILKKPMDVRASSPMARYQARYRVEGNRLTGERRLILRPRGVPCYPRDLNLANRVFRLALADRGQKIRFQAQQAGGGLLQDSLERLRGDAAGR